MLKTPLYDKHVSLGAKIAPFGGWLMPIQYQGILAEHAHTRQAVSVFDICHMGEFIIEADPLLSGLDQIVTQNITGMLIGSCRYGFMLNEEAGIIDDLIVYRIDKNKWMLVVNAATISKDEEHIRKHLQGSYNFKNVSDNLGKLDVQGPESSRVLKDIFGQAIEQLRYYTFAEFIFENERCIISRTGYTGELGFEIYISDDSLIKLWDLLLKDQRVKPAGLGCRDTLRLEMGYPLYGQDLDTAHTPLAAGMAKFVDFGKDFIGKDILENQESRGLKEHLIYFQAETRRAPRHGFSILDKENRIGTVTSGSFSPSLSVGIGMGYVCGDYAIGSQLITKELDKEIQVKVVKKPFYNRPKIK